MRVLRCLTAGVGILASSLSVWANGGPTASGVADLPKRSGPSEYQQTGVLPETETEDGLPSHDTTTSEMNTLDSDDATAEGSGLDRYRSRRQTWNSPQEPAVESEFITEDSGENSTGTIPAE